MRHLIKKISALFLSASLILTGIMPATAQASGQSVTATRGVYWFDPHETGYDLTDTFIYDDALLTGDSSIFSEQLATMSFELAVASISSEREKKTEAGYANKSRNLRAYLEDNGFIDFETNADYKTKMKTMTMGVACAHKKIIDKGKTYTLIAIVPRSAGYESEWGGNFVLNEDEQDTGDSYGFRNGKNKVLEHTRQYIKKHGITGDIKVWTAGYSRGAGVTNQVGAALLSDPATALGSSVTLAPGDLYCYTFGTPNSAASPTGSAGVPSADLFKYIHNNWMGYDVVTKAPPARIPASSENTGFTRYGQNHEYDNGDAAQRARMLEFLKVTNRAVYDRYVDGGDPLGYAPKTIDLKKLLLEGKFEIKDIEGETYLPKTQAEFLSMMSEAYATAVEDRATYVSGQYQDGMEHIAGYLMSHLDKAGNIIDSVTGSKLALPLVAFMYFSYMVDRYDITAFTQSKEVILAEITRLEDIIREMEEEGETVPEALKTKLAELKADLQDQTKWDQVNEVMRVLTAALYSKVMGDALTEAGLKEEDIDLYNAMTGLDESKAMTRLLSYMLLYDRNQTQEAISWDTALVQVNEQIQHFATFVGNAGSYMRVHNNEVILSWLRTNDPSYDDFVKEDDARKAGYRRVYITAPAGVKLTGTVKDGSGKNVATFENGRLLSSTDPWVAITTCDKGNWLRLPVDQTYRIVLKTDRDAKIDLRVAEFDNYEGKVTREVEKDSKYNWKGLAMTPYDTVTLVVSQSGLVTKQGYPDIREMQYKAMDGKAAYYIEMSGFSVTRPTIYTIANMSKKTMNVSWSKVAGADGYKISWRVAGKKWKTKKTTKRKYKVKNLKKGKLYEFRVAATKKATAVSTAKTGPYSKPMYRWYKRVKAWAAGQRKAADITWTKAKGAGGYIVLVSTKKNMTDPRQYKIKGGSKTQRKIKGLKSGKTYYVMVRPYKKKKGHRYDGVTTSAKRVVVI